MHLSPTTGLIAQFGTHNGSLLGELDALHRSGNAAFLVQACRAVDEALEYLDARERAESYPQGFALCSWLESGNAPSNEYLERSLITLPCVHILQLCKLHREFLIPSGAQRHAAYLGHSVGLLSAIVAAAADNVERFIPIACASIRHSVVASARCHAEFQRQRERFERPVQSAGAFGQPTPMASLIGMSVESLSRLIAAYNRAIGNDPICLALDNGGGLFVLSGHPELLDDFAHRHQAELSAKGVQWAYMKASLPFHSGLLAGVIERFSGDRDFIGYRLTGADLRSPVYATHDAHNLQHDSDLYLEVLRQMASLSLHWKQVVLRAVSDTGACEIVDYGPGMAAMFFSKGVLRSAGVPMKYRSVKHTAQPLS